MSSNRRQTASSPTAAFHTLDLITTLLFNNVSPQPLVNKMKSVDLEAAVTKLLLEEENENNLQKYLAPYLRNAAISHLRSGKSTMAIEFRKNYKNLSKQGYLTAGLELYLKTQAKNREWATEVEAAALGDLFNMTVLVTGIKNGIVQSSHILNKSTDPTAPVLQIFNSDNVHWFLEPDYPERTIDDGNCLYNAFALALRQSALHQQIKQKTDNDPSYTLSPKTQKKYKPAKILRTETIRLQSIATMIKQIAEVKPDTENPSVSLRLYSDDDSPPLISKKTLKGILPHRFIPLNKYDPFAMDFYGELNMLINKAGELEAKSLTEPKYKAAAKVAGNLVFELSQTAHKYFNQKGKLKSGQFVKLATKQINKARPVLEKHRGWSQILGNVALAIIGVGVGYLVAGVIHKAITGKFLFFKTESAENLDQMAKAVKSHSKRKPDI